MILLSILILALIIIIHELGHFFMARMCKIDVPELALGFGPKIGGVKYGNTDYNLRAIPLGGFCRLQGENTPEFKQYPAWKRLLVYAGGPLFNLTATFLALFVFFFLVAGVPDAQSTVVGYAEDSALEKGDKIISIDGQKISSWGEINSGTAVIERDGELLTKSINNETILPPLSQHQFTDSLGASVHMIGMFTGAMVDAFSDGNAELSGPVGIVSATGDTAESSGMVGVLVMFATLNFSVALVNLFPMPVLDGGHIALLGIEKIQNKPLSPKVEFIAHAVGVVGLLMIFLVATMGDLVSIVAN